MTCNAISYQKAEITNEQLARLLKDVDCKALAQQMRMLLTAKKIEVKNDYSNSTAINLAFYAAGYYGEVVLDEGRLTVSHPNKATADAVRDMLLPLLQGVASKQLQARVAKWAAANTKVRGAQTLPDGTLMLKVSI